MTDLLFHEDSYLREMVSTVIRVEDEWVELDKTIFYPLGGGQPGDVGTFTDNAGDTLAVLDTKKGAEAGSIRHQVSADHKLGAGDQVTIRIVRRNQHRGVSMAAKHRFYVCLWIDRKVHRRV